MKILCLMTLRHVYIRLTSKHSYYIFNIEYCSLSQLHSKKKKKLVWRDWKEIEEIYAHVQEGALFRTSFEHCNY